MKKVLCIVSSAYRATQEEQDDSILWLTHAMQKAGGQLGVLLAESAVNYAVADQDPGGVSIGELAIERPPRPNRDLLAMKEGGVSIYVLGEDARERGIDPDRIEPAFETVSRRSLPALFARHDEVWHW